ncbi:hypothetical protein VNO78_20698 [Psophocarpus tetragonolobus]|uniref:Uncharacterized protein n=1 Tax=Psophocarpus tetragonolobus TaxID=3891 RepID=A0AAN9SAV4_PSOTE
MLQRWVCRIFKKILRMHLYLKMEGVVVTYDHYSYWKDLHEQIAQQDKIAGGESMDYGSGRRRVEILSGKNYGCSQSYVATIASEVIRASHSGEATATKPWSFGDPESKRRKRIAKYKVYAVEGKVKATLRDGIRWIKHTCYRIVHGY